MPGSLRMIDMGAFIGCTSLTNVILPESVIEIRKMAFGNCPNITSVTIPKTVSKDQRREAFDSDIYNKVVSKSGNCYVATAVYGSYDCPQVWTLRRFRDDTLAKTWYGRAFVHAYYVISPILVGWFGHTEWFKNMWKPTLDRMVEKLRKEGVEDTPYEDKNW